MNPFADDRFPTDIQLQYVPFSSNDAEKSMAPVAYDLKSELPNKKIIITSAGGPLDPRNVEHDLPNYLSRIEEFKSKGISKIVVLTADDPHANREWSRSLGYQDEDNYVIFATDPNAALSSELGEDLAIDLSKQGLGRRPSIYAAIVEDGHLRYLGSDEGGASPSSSRRSSAASLLERL